MKVRNLREPPKCGHFQNLFISLLMLLKVDQVLCENSCSDGSPCVINPRYVVRTQINKLQHMGYTFLSEWGT